MKTKNILTGAFIALTTIGCTDLDVDIKSQYTEFPDSEIAYDAQMNNAFYTDSVARLAVVLTKGYPVTLMNILLLVLMAIT